ncbi:CGNR zinc finger domain-containing protein [Micromonospora sp. NBC_01796]|uniref:CGNR zinc finger domain-containing protein n=1 Tax=Micromonospora sp. NBC_01796 TaxID=2975987 RepID=UPI002DDC3A11|nr:CGNR zinc finger domain-containing protein [Micromonospora sp. NBC_01796]WSA88846.1 CGNR zinc finger domain-containing protein [Micromonospora sp. NBC_01796]
MVGDWRRPQRSENFRWGNGRLAFAYCATLGDRGSQTPIERLTSVEALLLWAVEAQLADPAGPPPAALAPALELREAIYATGRAVSLAEQPDRDDVALINDWAGRPGAVPQLVVEPPGQPYSRIRATSVDQVLADVARDAVDAIGNSPLRVRRCAAPTCLGVFLDDSPAATRRWCSMSTCGNRSKKATYRQQYAVDTGQRP